MIIILLCNGTEGFGAPRGDTCGEALGHTHRATNSICLVHTNIEVTEGGKGSELVANQKRFPGEQCLSPVKVTRQKEEQV